MKRTGFALVEAAVLVLVAACIAAVLLLLGAEQRRQGRLGEDIGKMRRIAALTGEYAAGNADKFWTFSWRRGQNLSQYPDLNGAVTDVQAAANQAVDILRRLAGRTDIAPMTWIAQFTFSQLALADGGYARLPDAEFISAQDRNRLVWSRDPAGFDQGQYPPIPASVDTNARKRFPYSSSFVLPTSFYDHGTPVWIPGSPRL